MNDDNKKNTGGEKEKQNLVYAIADYKQLVLQYRTTHTELVKSLSFWKTTAAWLTAAAVACLVFGVSLYIDNRRQAAKDLSIIAAMSARLQSLAERFESREQELARARADLEDRDARIQQLEKNISTASKTQAEKLLKDSGTK